MGIIQAQYELLNEFIHRFQTQAEISSELNQKFRSHTDALNGQWLGEGSQAFFREMEEEIFPALHHLTRAFEQSSDAMREIIRILQHAEEDAANLFRAGGPDALGVPDGTGSSTPQPMPVLDRQTMETNYDRVFTETYMERFIGSEFQGEDSAALNAKMLELYQLLRAGSTDQTRIDGLLDELAGIRGVDPADFHAQWDRFVELSGYPTDFKGHIDEDIYDYFGRTAQMRYGAVVGDVLGVDPVFGALLNPTGGRVGPGSDSYEPLDNDALGYHGVFHDASGYLYNFQGALGNGYNYLGRPDFWGSESEKSGQIGGIAWWATQPGLGFHIDLSRLAPDTFVPDFIQNAALNSIEFPVSAWVHDRAFIFEGQFDAIDGVSDILRRDYIKGVGNLAEGYFTVFGQGIF